MEMLVSLGCIRVGEGVRRGGRGGNKGMDHGWGYGRRRTSWNMKDRSWDQY